VVASNTKVYTYRNQHAGQKFNLFRVLKSSAASLVYNFQVEEIKYLPLVDIIRAIGGVCRSGGQS
jgi:hypothetical protein